MRGGLKAQDSNPGSIRILDAGCGTGVSTDYLCHLNSGAEILAVDISAGALDVARERLRRSGGADQVRSLRQEQCSLLDLQEEGRFDYINSVGVLHHLRDPLAGLKALGQRLAPQGLFAFVSLCRCRPLGDSSHAASPGAFGCGDRRQRLDVGS